jgi:large subunit ribosomal protein L15
MQLHDLKPIEGAKKERKRVGRGRSAGQGKTAGRGTKGQGARTGGGTRLYHQGGNLPFFRRLPFMRGKGFTPINRVEYHEVNVGQLKSFEAKSDVNPESLIAAKLVKDKSQPIVLMGEGNVDVALNVSVHRITKGARSKIESAGGSVELISRQDGE